MSDIGAAAGIVGSGIYRHFDGKSAVLVALFDRVIDDLTRDSAEILARGLDPATTLAQLIEAHVRIVLEDRTLMRVYHTEIANLPADDSRRLRRKQRLYIEEWVHVLEAAAPGGRRRRAAGAGARRDRRRPVDPLLRERPARRAAGRADGGGRAGDPVRPDPGGRPAVSHLGIGALGGGV